MATEKFEENMRDTAYRVCMEEENRRRTDPNETHERSIIVVGGKRVGKTTMIYRFLEKEEAPKPTIAMDYSFGRKAGKSLVKNIVHVWEVGHLDSSLISAAMKGSVLTHSPHHTALLMILDLSKPELLWASIEETLSVVRSSLKASYDEKIVREMRDRKINELGKESEVHDPFPMKMCIVGGKYDEFKELGLDKKELIGRTLRAVAHSLGAGLHYHSAKDKVLTRRTKDLLSHYGFGAPATTAKCTDYEKPLTIPVGADSFSSIDLHLSETRPSEILDAVKQIYISRFPQVSSTVGSGTEDPSNDPNFAEPIIDRLRSQREEEISVLLQEMLDGRTPKIPIPDPY